MIMMMMMTTMMMMATMMMFSKLISLMSNPWSARQVKKRVGTRWSMKQTQNTSNTSTGYRTRVRVSVLDSGGVKLLRVTIKT